MGFRPTATLSYVQITLATSYLCCVYNKLHMKLAAFLKTTVTAGR